MPVSADAAFAWHQRPGAFERLLPPWERVQVVERRGGLEDGGEVVLRVHFGPVTFRWLARHRDYVQDRQFADEQVEGPFSHWLHRHVFEPEGANASRLTDRIEFSLPLGPAGAALSDWAIRSRLERMLQYRHRLLQDDLKAHQRAPQQSLNVLVTGSSGLVGSSLIPFLTTGGHRVTRLVRRTPRSGEIQWDPSAGRLDPAELEGIDAVVHLAGENLAARWSPARKRAIRDSRVSATRLLAHAVAQLQRRPRVLVSTSAVGVYGNRGDQVLTETDADSATPPDFLVDVVREWEAATEPARAAGIRVVLLRSGLVLSPAGGVLGRMLPAFRMGAGGRLGSGRQWMSWIAIDDTIGAIHHALTTDSLSGPVNATAPNPVTNREFAATLGRVLGRPAVLPAPATALRLAFGEMADVALLAGARVVPARLTQSGYQFRHPHLEDALRFVLGREK
ncbi:MAG TPA: TIGR01777 family oxidoreductase [Gemmatimonadales bacterium]